MLKIEAYSKELVQKYICGEKLIFLDGFVSRKSLEIDANSSNVLLLMFNFSISFCVCSVPCNLLDYVCLPFCLVPFPLSFPSLIIKFLPPIIIKLLYREHYPQALWHCRCLLLAFNHPPSVTFVFPWRQKFWIYSKMLVN